jgi:pimeloyl-ACP methyl ester carboxylesterase
MPKVTSKDGTTIAYDKAGQGLAVILVEGALGSRRASAELAKLLAPAFTVYSYDRRGRGESTDTKPYSVQKEVEDIEALLDSAGEAACLYGISSGGALALEAAAGLDRKVKKLAIYEVPYDSSEPGIKAFRAYRTTLSELVEAGRRADAVALFMKFVGVPDEMIEGTRHTPMWQSMEMLAPTLVYDAAVLGEDRTVPVSRVSDITAHTLIMDGGQSYGSMPFMRTTAEVLTRAIPNAQHRVIEGQGHDIDIKVLAPVLTEFFQKENETTIDPVINS